MRADKFQVRNLSTHQLILEDSIMCDWTFTDISAQPAPPAPYAHLCIMPKTPEQHRVAASFIRLLYQAGAVLRPGRGSDGKLTLHIYVGGSQDPEILWIMARYNYRKGQPAAAGASLTTQSIPQKEPIA
jgi:hypothetical protein